MTMEFSFILRRLKQETLESFATKCQTDVSPLSWYQISCYGDYGKEGTF